MRLGILADIHEDVESLGEALALLRGAGVERLVVLGDLFYGGHRVEETTDVLVAAGVEGVWGNHDLGLCHDPDPLLTARYAERVFAFTRMLGPRYEIEDCLFTHGLPCQDAYDPVAYYLGEQPESEAGQAASFAASASRVLFLGHFHRWLAATEEGVMGWKGGESITLERGRRYLVVIAAVCDGWCAEYDTTSGVLTPYRLER